MLEALTSVLNGYDCSADEKIVAVTRLLANLRQDSPTIAASETALLKMRKAEAGAENKAKLVEAMAQAGIPSDEPFELSIDIDDGCPFECVCGQLELIYDGYGIYDVTVIGRSRNDFDTNIDADWDKLFELWSKFYDSETNVDCLGSLIRALCTGNFEYHVPLPNKAYAGTEVEYDYCRIYKFCAEGRKIKVSKREGRDLLKCPLYDKICNALRKHDLPLPELIEIPSSPAW